MVPDQQTLQQDLQFDLESRMTADLQELQAQFPGVAEPALQLAWLRGAKWGGRWLGGMQKHLMQQLHDL